MKNGRSFNLRQRSVLSLGMLVLFSIGCQNDPSTPSASATPNARVEPASSANRQTGKDPGTDSAPAAVQPLHNTEPGIQITDIPSKGAGPDAVQTIAGRVSGVKATDCKVVIFAHTDTWYVQPYIGSSDTAINEDGTWRSDTHLGDRYAALLVKASYKPPTTTGKLPAVGGLVLAIATVDAK
jgi:hypothetical protein